MTTADGPCALGPRGPRAMAATALGNRVPNYRIRTIFCVWCQVPTRSSTK
jgi:hypothetical protein